MPMPTFLPRIGPRCGIALAGKRHGLQTRRKQMLFLRGEGDSSGAVLTREDPLDSDELQERRVRSAPARYLHMKRAPPGFRAAPDDHLSASSAKVTSPP